MIDNKNLGNIMQSKKLLRSQDSNFNTDNFGDLSDLLTKTFKVTNNDLNKNLNNITDYSGSTGNQVVVYNNHFFCANVGDSRACILKKEPKSWSIIEISKDHKPNIPTEKERIIAAGGRVERSLRIYLFYKKNNLYSCRWYIWGFIQSLEEERKWSWA